MTTNRCCGIGLLGGQRSPAGALGADPLLDDLTVLGEL
jgi:hypothetical protein